jgi:hypothetical protein
MDHIAGRGLFRGSVDKSQAGHERLAVDAERIRRVTALAGEKHRVADKNSQSASGRQQ